MLRKGGCCEFEASLVTQQDPVTRKKLGTQEEGVFPWLPSLQRCFRIFSPGQARDTQGIVLCLDDLMYIQVILRFRK